MLAATAIHTVVNQNRKEIWKALILVMCTTWKESNLFSSIFSCSCAEVFSFQFSFSPTVGDWSSFLSLLMVVNGKFVLCRGCGHLGDSALREGFGGVSEEHSSLQPWGTIGLLQNTCCCDGPTFHARPAVAARTLTFRCGTYISWLLS